jgi:hypothetical protein
LARRLGMKKREFYLPILTRDWLQKLLDNASEREDEDGIGNSSFIEYIRVEQPDLDALMCEVAEDSLGVALQVIVNIGQDPGSVFRALYKAGFTMGLEIANALCEGRGSELKNLLEGAGGGEDK